MIATDFDVSYSMSGVKEVTESCALCGKKVEKGFSIRPETLEDLKCLTEELKLKKKHLRKPWIDLCEDCFHDNFRMGNWHLCSPTVKVYY